MEQKETTTWRENTALERFQMIAPLMEEGLDRDKKVELRKQIAAKNELSVKTLRRYERAWLEGGFSGLKPAEQNVEPETSRFLDVLEKKHTESQLKLANAISFSHYRKEEN